MFYKGSAPHLFFLKAGASTHHEKHIGLLTSPHLFLLFHLFHLFSIFGLADNQFEERDMEEREMEEREKGQLAEKESESNIGELGEIGETSAGAWKCVCFTMVLPRTCF